MREGGNKTWGAGARGGLSVGGTRSGYKRGKRLCNLKRKSINEPAKLWLLGVAGSLVQMREGGAGTRPPAAWQLATILGTDIPTF